MGGRDHDPLTCELCLGGARYLPPDPVPSLSAGGHDASERLREFLQSLPPGQEYKVEHHDPPTDKGYVYTVQLIGPPGMVAGEFVGWDVLADRGVS